MAKLGLPDHVKFVSFRLFSKAVPRFHSFELIYQKSDIPLLYESYMSVMFFVSVVVFVSAFVVSIIVHEVFFRLSVFQLCMASLVLSLIATLLVPILFVLFPLLRMNQKRKEIDANLVYTVGYMGVLSAGGISVERILNRVIEVEPRVSIRKLAKRVVSNVRMFGMDVASSLEDVLIHSSSDTFAKLLAGMVNTIKTSGDLKTLFVFETKRLLTVKREQLKKTLSALIALAEVYVTAVVMAPIAFIVMMTILSILGTAQFGLSPATQLNLVVFFVLPSIFAIFIVVLDGVLPKEE
jgi:flagellar protein FlaJ